MKWRHSGCEPSGTGNAGKCFSPLHPLSFTHEIVFASISFSFVIVATVCSWPHTEFWLKCLPCPAMFFDARSALIISVTVVGKLCRKRTSLHLWKGRLINAVLTQRVGVVSCCCSRTLRRRQNKCYLFSSPSKCPPLSTPANGCAWGWPERPGFGSRRKQREGDVSVQWESNLAVNCRWTVRLRTEECAYVLSDCSGGL